eukprot:2414405-Rhodomonas_salina.3
MTWPSLSIAMSSGTSEPEEPTGIAHSLTPSRSYLIRNASVPPNRKAPSTAPLVQPATYTLSCLSLTRFLDPKCSARSDEPEPNDTCHARLPPRGSAHACKPAVA